MDARQTSGGPMQRLQQDTFKVFVSHKSDDAGLAKVVADGLTELAPGLIECWVSGESLTAGTEWDREIKKQLGQSHLLVLLFTTPNHTWDWCLYEVGLFVRFDADDVSSVACLCDPDGSPPAPLMQLQCVSASPDRIAKQLLRPLCLQTWEMSDTWLRGALVSDVSDELVDTIAVRISQAFTDALTNDGAAAADGVYRYRPCHRIVLDLAAGATEAAWDGIPRQARVVEGVDATTSYTLSLFRAHEGTAAWTWGDLVAEVGGDDQPWLRDLDQSFVHSLTRHLWSPSMEVVEVWQPDSDRRRAYRPVVSDLVRRARDDVPLEVTIMLLPEELPDTTSVRSTPTSWTPD